jgi:TrmH family RNA methyltransferase
LNAAIQMETQQLTSVKNPLLKEIRRAIVRGTLTESGECVAESFHLLEEAIRSECRVSHVIVSESVRSAVETRIKGLRIRVLHIPDALMRQVSSTETPQGVIALVRPPEWQLDHLLRGQSLVILLDGIQDPGDAGAMVRAAEAFGATGAIFLKGSVNPFNPKALRAAAGSTFRLPVVYGIDEELVLAALQTKRIDLYAAMPNGSRVLAEVDLTRRAAFVIGSEGQGVREKLRSRAEDLRIPVRGVESLNAAVAASVLLYEAARQRHAQS